MRGALQWLPVAALTGLLFAGCSTAATDVPTLVVGTPSPSKKDASLADPDALASPADTLAASADVPAGTPDAEAGDVAAPADVALAADAPAAQDVAAPVDVPVAAPDVAAPVDVPVATPDVAAPVDVAPAKDVAPPAAVCGNGVCEPPAETAATCAADCGLATGACLLAKCPSQMTTCSSTPACAAVLPCASACGDLTCLDACTTSLSYTILTGSVAPLALCGQQKGCLAGAKPGPGGGPASCGNGACDNGETHLTCPKDCAFPISPSEQCQVQQCAASYTACAADSACVAAATCWNQGGGFGQCVKSDQVGNVLNTLINCIQSSCSNVGPNLSCQGRCGTFSQGAACNCDKGCKQYKDCCADYATFCG